MAEDFRSDRTPVGLRQAQSALALRALDRDDSGSFLPYKICAPHKPLSEPIVCGLSAGESWIRTTGSYPNLKSSSRGMLRFIDIVHTHLGAGAMVQPFFCCAWNHTNHSTEPGWGTD